MDNLERLLKFTNCTKPVSDASILTCGCLVSERQFLTENLTICLICRKENVSILCEIKPLRELYQILFPKRRSSRKIDDAGSTDLMGLFYKFAKEDQAEEQESIEIVKPSSASSIQSHSPIINRLEKTLLESVSEEKEYNFSKCFPFYRQVSSFHTNQLKFNFLGPLKGSNIRRAINTSIYSYLNMNTGLEITTFVLINEKRWELYEFIGSNIKLVCCGKATGEYGISLANLSFSTKKEIIIRNDFSNASTTQVDLKEVLSNYDQMYCKLTKNFLIISGTRGVLRVLNVNPDSKYELGQPIYTYVTDFPIRCISVSPNESLIACGITAKEKLSGKEQPFVILHKMTYTTILESVDPITITIPYRDPIKIINFNSTSNHLVVATTWESRYFIIKLKTEDSFRKPRLIWSDYVYKPNESDSNSVTNLMMSNESITDVKFGNQHSNSIVITSCSLKKTPPVLIRLDGLSLDTFEDESINSSEDEHQIRSAEIISKFPETGSLIHKVAISPKDDGIIFLDRDGKLYLVTNYTNHRKKIVVLLGEVANSERFAESASVEFSPDGGKVFTIDRKCNFQVFDFTKGIPGEDANVIKCKIINIV